MTVITGDGAPPGKLKVKVKFGSDGPDPEGLARWDVYAKRYLIIEVKIGSVTAAGRSDALDKAQQRWPRERKLTVSPAT